MKRVTISILVLAMVLVLSGLALAAEEKKPDATLNSQRGRLAWASDGVGGKGF